MTAGEETTSLNALRALGPAAVPVLLNAVYANDTGLKRFELFIWTQLPVIIKSRLLAPIPAAQRLVRMGVVKTLGQLGSEAKPAVPALTRLLEETSDEPLRRALVHALLIIEPGNPRPVEAE